ncbi:MAG TPA: formylglycine-generating enzyme family protein [Polyangiaceae bacterium]|nr:formylglycine-generating enzyme family protein [Polyangiaceae bacterium]
MRLRQALLLPLGLLVAACGGGVDETDDLGAAGTAGTAGTGGGANALGAGAPSCAGGLDCGGLSCCEATLVSGGTFPMGRSDSGADAFAGGDADEIPEHVVTVDSFRLDVFEVTVGRFRKFVEAFDGTPPSAGAGDHHGLGAGWDPAWNGMLPATREELVKQVNQGPNAMPTWTPEAGDHERAAINFVPWYAAFAFCVWDGGRLPTEAEWEYAAAGGSENRLFAWGSDDPAANPNLANGWGSPLDSPFTPVGSHPLGNGKWGHRDLAGGLAEWVIDSYDESWYAGEGSACSNCASTKAGSDRVLRGGAWGGQGNSFTYRAASRDPFGPSLEKNAYAGFRCARSAL